MPEMLNVLIYAVSDYSLLYKNIRISYWLHDLEFVWPERDDKEADLATWLHQKAEIRVKAMLLTHSFKGQTLLSHLLALPPAPIFYLLKQGGAFCRKPFVCVLKLPSLFQINLISTGYHNELFKIHKRALKLWMEWNFFLHKYKKRQELGTF